MTELNENDILKIRQTAPPIVKKKIHKVVFKNLIIVVAIFIYFMFLNLGYYNIEKSVYIIDLKVFSIAILAIAIICFEKSYVKDNEAIFLNGIEALLLAFITLIMPYTLFETSDTVRDSFMMSCIYFGVYYIIKSLVQMIKIKRDYSISDVKEIIKNK